MKKTPDRRIMAPMNDRQLLEEAIQEARTGLQEGGLPIGSVLGDLRNNHIVARGHNLRVQSGDPTAHAEIVCIRNAGPSPRLVQSRARKYADPLYHVCGRRTAAPHPAGDYQ